MKRCNVCSNTYNPASTLSGSNARSSRRRLAWISSTGLLMLSGSRFLWRLSSSRSFTTRLEPMNKTSANEKQRLLFITTSLSEFDTGRRQTVAGYDRFAQTILPVLRESVTSLVGTYQVDVYLISNYTLSSARYDELRKALPDTVGLQIWDDATPIGYEKENSVDHVRLHTRGLARQHRYVLKDKYWFYDLFVCLEDDMLIRRAHVDHYIRMTETLYQWRITASTTLDQFLTAAQSSDLFYGPMTTRQLARTIPGFMRVEAALPDFVPPTQPQHRHDQIPVDYTTRWTHGNVTRGDIETGIDPSVCCHVAPETVNDHVPASPDRNHLYFWEMSIESLGVRKMPPSNNSFLDWVVVLGGSNNEIWEDGTYIVGDYWSGRPPTYYFGPKAARPDRREGRFANNQGGWMATRRQVAEWHLRWCRGGLLPPYNPPFYQDDGLDGRSVEYWSGGLQLVGVNSCNLQRIVSMDAQGFSRQLLYHTSNNKQRSGRVRRHFSGRSIHEFWGQLNTICKNAESVRLEELARQGNQ